MTLAELMVSACVTTLVAGAALGAAVPLQRGFAAHPETAGLTQRIRVVADVLAADVRRASLVLPLRVGDVDSDVQRDIFHRDDVMTVLTEPVEALAGGIITPIEMRTYHLRQDGEGVWQLMLYDGHASDQPAVEDVVGLRFEYFGAGEAPVATVSESGELRVTYGPVPPQPEMDDPSDSWGAGENCTITRLDGAYVPRLASLGAEGLVPLPRELLADGPWCPDSSHAFRFDADLLRVRRVRVQVRLQASRPFRGALDAWFVHGGSAVDPARYVPDTTLTLDVGLRNARAR